MLVSLIIVFLVSFLITALSSPLTIRLAKKYGLVDDPKLRPHPAHFHQSIIPRAGGLTIYLGVILTILFFIPITKAVLGIILGTTTLLVLGLIDDKVKTFNPYWRLIILFVAAGFAVGSGIGITFIGNPLYDSFHIGESLIRLDTINIPFDFFGRHNIVLIADLLGFFWIVSLTQVINWAKGVDGQMPSITFIASLVLGFLSLKLFLEGDPHQLAVAQMSFIVAGASLSLLIFNWYPAKILPGFSASTILAFLLAVLSILSGAKLATACLTMAIPIIDFLYTFFRRIVQGRSPVWGDRGHLHHKLLDIGWNPQKISIFYLLASSLFGLLAIFSPSLNKFFTLLFVTIVILIFILWINSFGVLSKKSDPGSGSKT